ncbi:hypothetical protein [Kozakia baliensis]|uniref:Uncharacterized protein n=1 Tax=Kozakia baliensis TaxID=153496 RepID=A0A1D8UYK7_9PROT|nr:hypothetical protein [Kozakia baliensis]AOX18720.1 hypothetical protein A0U89_15560 [Kozakia baliensis]AOX21468.1 hypothetical protein A0U90_13245 [Kozakia baliensis]GBR35245.1 hypothetical protein AA0488_2938 [Kozakia baliensis NRIC 0488]GEL65747.1 hypothetical protein KBA01_30330 [Kozakia baliensis]
MSNADTAIAQAHTAAQEQKANKAAASKARARRFAETVQRKDVAPVITVEAVKALIPTDAQMAAIARSFAIDEVDTDEIFGAGYNAVMDEIKVLEPALVVSIDGEKNFRALEMHMQRIVGARVASAYGQAQFYETKRQAARELSSAHANDSRDEDRMGIDGLANRAAFAREFAAQLGMKAYALAALAEGAAKAYAEYFGTEWKPYAKGNARSLNQQAAAAQIDALGF